MGQIIPALAQHLGAAFPTRTIDVKNTICDTLSALGYPPWCEDFSPMIKELNGKEFFTLKVAADAKMTVPDIQVERFQGKRRTEQATAIAKNWQHLGATVNVSHPGAVPVLTFQGYRFTLKVQDDNVAVDAAVFLSKLDVDNVQIQPVLSATRTPTLYSSNYAEIERRCKTNYPYDYSSLNYQDLSEVVDQAERAALDGQLAAIRPEEVVVSLIDTPLMMSPNLNANIATKSWKCVWEDFTEKNHATHLAGIIGSAANGFGFVGLAQTVKWDPFIWSEPGTDGKLKVVDEASNNLMDFLNDRADLNLQVFVAALSFDSYPSGLLDQRPEQRFTYGVLANAIRSISGLMVVAAGQADATAHIPRQPISITSPLSPQDLGDQENVIIVTACEVCGRTEPRLFSEANFSQSERPYIHVAAPGGQLIPGWITDHSVGASNGTSQAAAYVAGEAAAMISHYPRVYARARAVKRRIQVTSWPLPQDHDAPQQLAAGLVDPVLALFDPTKHWAKKTGGTWQVLPIKSLNLVSFQYKTGAPVGNFRNSDILRILKISDKNWVIYVDSSKYQSQHGKPIGIDGEVTLVSGVYPTKNAKLTTCDGKDYPLYDYEDIVLASGGVNATHCP
jgi:subtilisin family serine protease